MMVLILLGRGKDTKGLPSDDQRFSAPWHLAVRKWIDIMNQLGQNIFIRNA